MSEAIAIRRGTVRDRAFVIDLGRRVSPTSVSTLRIALPPLVEGAYERLVEYVLAREHDVIVADVEGTPAGFALLIYDLPDEITLSEQAFIAYMAVEPAWQRRGIGRMLLASIETEARKRGLPYLSLMVTEDNAAAQALYAEAGFATERRMLTKTL
ncbi:MAG TPA: GNAT family N-acetyltransferase [Candidatus Lustribacter sp.]|jgi:ribosomal protein S18 acetylase RimI-like enzyme|nr:GNAT family N-acetyltransferase [Candidatus Lustribacter sp.]